MTQEQSLQIRELRSQGMGYRAIASMVKLPRDAVRNYCKSRGIAGYRIEYDMNLRERMKEGRACAFCGAELKRKRTGRPKRFCCEMCRRSYWRIHRSEQKKNPSAIYYMECPYCHEVFEVYANSHRKYCCHEHYILDRFGPRMRSAVPDGAAFFMCTKEQMNGV